jgi:hypothetical protein
MNVCVCVCVFCPSVRLAAGGSKSKAKEPEGESDASGESGSEDSEATQSDDDEVPEEEEEEEAPPERAPDWNKSTLPPAHHECVCLFHRICLAPLLCGVRADTKKKVKTEKAAPKSGEAAQDKVVAALLKNAITAELLKLGLYRKLPASFVKTLGVNYDIFANDIDRNHVNFGQWNTRVREGGERERESRTKKRAPQQIASVHVGVK